MVVKGSVDSGGGDSSKTSSAKSKPGSSLRLRPDPASADSAPTANPWLKKGGAANAALDVTEESGELEEMLLQQGIQTLSPSTLV